MLARGAVELFAAALVASVLGSMVGLGGGFIFVPILRLFLGFAPAEAAGTSLVLIVANSASGAFTYLLHKRVHVKIGLMVALGGLPSSILGAMLAVRMPPKVFDIVLAVILVAVAVDLFWNAERRMAGRPEHDHIHRIKGMSYRAAVGLGFVIGLFSSLFGLGGGIVLVPSFLYFSELPAHAISATSQFAILLTSPVGLVTHALQHDVAFRDAIPLTLGGLLGGPIGARLSLRLKSPQLLIAVAVSLVVAALSLVWRHL
ncbi:MAG: sulfite exporter TauE/SafE family protein [Candidatus Eremiobacteraeota bacterium]|nr:sulfite exporter TauE/SafE family protein [Candidatus Eremiobacteraeota bacterium]MBV8333349.1 sulfite exporter TauE/SafE family protein [Candidatus Eremiobacteraeota bacterium]MBV8433602.1 sulfite exporter TauE/SafE family protein [Candidatus Eremiobacteraeota bacterium]MBV8721473.1 sulfite exporter TauE/SafE family protein [Candidatus Eremiobacteraeota bacterium]